jgi:hypothetical protein
MKNIERLKNEVKDNIIDPDKKLELLIMLEIAENIHWVTEEINELRKTIMTK